MQLTNPLIFLSKALEGNFAQTPSGIRYWSGVFGKRYPVMQKQMYIYYMNVTTLNERSSMLKPKMLWNSRTMMRLEIYPSNKGIHNNQEKK